jgi:hypothetical protein
MDDPDGVTPIGQRLGSESLYSEYRTPPEPDKPKAKRKPHGKLRRPKEATPLPGVVQINPGQAKQADRNLVKMANIFSYCLEIAGIVSITAGCAMIAPWLAFVVGGILCVLFGVLTTPHVTK